MNMLKHTFARVRTQAGFTLLELVLVLFLIGLLASAGLLFTDNIESQQQYEETVERYERIRKAIIQSGERTVNNRPELRGFAVDMGRLPYCLAELLYTAGRSGTDFVSPCDDTITLAGPAISEQGIRTGWHGPYIQVAPDQDGSRYYRDGYGNGANDAINSGWNWSLFKDLTLPTSAFNLPSDVNNSGPDPEPALYLYLQSAGFDATVPKDNYPSSSPDEDNPASFLINQSAWTLPASSQLLVNFTTSASSTGFSFDDNDWEYTLANSNFETAISGLFEHTGATSSTTLNPGDSVSAQAPLNVNDTNPVPAGWYLLNIDCTGATCSDNESVSSPMKVMISPDQALAPIRWKIEP